MFSASIPVEPPSWALEARARLVRIPGGRRRITSQVARELGFELAVDPDVWLEAEFLYLGQDVRIQNGTRIVADRLYLGDAVTIGAGSSFSTDEVVLADGVFAGERVYVDLAGGRNPDSGLWVGPAGFIGSWVHVNTCRSVVIDTESALAPGAMIFTHSFWQSILEGYSSSFRPVRLESNASVGAGSKLFPGVTVGSGAVIMANSTVVADVPADTLVGGVPAVILRDNIRRPFDRAKTTRAISKLLKMLVGRLRERGCSIEVLSDRIYEVVIPDGSRYRVVVVDDEALVPAAPGEIIISISAWNSSEAGGTVFDLERKCVVGPENPLVFEMRNYFRRFGIRFQPYGWRADYRKGI